MLIFGTVFADSETKMELAHQWGMLHGRLNPECDLVLVDSASPWLIEDSYAPILQLGDNIGHLAKGGKDGWGRAFCTGLRYAIDHDYDYAVHIEGDSLCALDVMRACGTMHRHGLGAISTPVRGTKRYEKNWMETGLIFLDVDYAGENHVIEHYNWRDDSYKQYPQTPEFWLYRVLGSNLHMQLNWRTLRDDKKILSVDNVADFDWITHTSPEVFNAFADNVFVDA